MTLVNRVSAFFLAALAATLVVYSAVFYFVLRERLENEFDHELRGVLNPLVAAIEAETDSVKWQPTEHTIATGSSLQDDDKVCWVVSDGQQRIIAASADRGPFDPHSAASKEWFDYAIASRPEEAKFIESNGWRVLQRRIVPLPASEGQTSDDEFQERQPDEFDALVVTAARSTRNLQANLRQLAELTILLPAGAWLLAATLGRWFVRRAITPVAAMAAKARAMTGDAIADRLPASATRDELADLGDAFNALLDRRHRAFEEQRRFTGDAAHQLRTPLTVLGGQIDVALRRSRDADEYRRTLGVLHDEVGEMRKIVDSLLFIARADGDAPLPDREPLALERWLPKYLERWDNHPRRADMSLELGSPATVSASAPLLAQLLDNLIGNACKYSTPGSPITIAADGGDGAATIAVTDRGPGIAPADQAAVFEPFVRTAEARQRGVAGTGLGLSIAARIASALGGRITLASAPGSGSTFTAHFTGATEG